jgi:hypothetical protein
MDGACWRLGCHSRPPSLSALLPHTYEILVLDTEYGVSKSEFKTRHQYYEQSRLWRLLPSCFALIAEEFKTAVGACEYLGTATRHKERSSALGNRSNRFIQEASLSVVNDPTAKASKHAHFSRTLAPTSQRIVIQTTLGRSRHIPNPGLL